MTKIKKQRETPYAILTPISERWSPRAFMADSIDRETLRIIFEAARLAPSAFNAQPWSFIIGIKGDTTWDSILSTLIPFNQQWASTAPVLILACGNTRSEDGNHDNAYFQYDCGQALAYLSIQAMEKGVYTHQMAGFNKELAKNSFSLPTDIIPLTITAMGYPGNIEDIPESMHQQEKEIKPRKEFPTFVFTNKFGVPSELFNSSIE